MTSKLTRRAFLKKSSLVIAASALPGDCLLLRVSPAMAGEISHFTPHAFVEIATDDTVTVWIGQTNLGQGTHTGISLIIAEELDADWQKVQPKMALAGEDFKDPYWGMQVTGGSTGIRHRWDMFRKAGAGARQMLLEAAAKKWDIAPAKLSTRESTVIHPDGRTFSYGQLVDAAQTLPFPEKPALKAPEDYRLIGSDKERFDIPDKVAGKTKFGIDQFQPDMCIACVSRPPRFGAEPVSYDEEAAMSVTGVIKVVRFANRVGVCAENTWAAMQGREKLNIQWTPGTMPDLDSGTIKRSLQEGLTKQGAVAEETGDAAKAMTEADVTVDGDYTFPYLAHAALEPINCTAHVEKDRCRVWVPTQGQTMAQMMAAKITGLTDNKVEIMTTPAGGGFGLRSEPDPVEDSVTLSKIVGLPVKVMWTREDDFTNDYFRPGAATTIKAGLDKEGMPIAWIQKVVAPSIMSRFAPQSVKNGVDSTAVQGIPDMVYKLPNRHVEYVMTDLPIPVGFWRSVGYSYTTFSVETMIDELAAKANKDPVEFRLSLMEKDSRPYRVLQLLADKSGWADTVPVGRSRGVAIAECFGSSSGYMAEVSVDEDSGGITVHKLVAVIDCGLAVFPNAIKAQMEGGAIMALSAAFHEEVEFSGGGVITSNYDDYPILTMAEVPEIEVHIAQSVHPVGGTGELPVPPLAPAVANAVFKATGVMLRDLPFKTDLLKKT